MYFPLLKDEHELLQATVFEDVYARYGHLRHCCPGLLLEGRVEQNPRKGFSFLGEKIANLGRRLSTRHTDSSAQRVHGSHTYERTARGQKAADENRPLIIGYDGPLPRAAYSHRRHRWLR